MEDAGIGMLAPRNASLAGAYDVAGWGTCWACDLALAM